MKKVDQFYTYGTILFFIGVCLSYFTLSTGEVGYFNIGIPSILIGIILILVGKKLEKDESKKKEVEKLDHYV